MPSIVIRLSDAEAMSASWNLGASPRPKVSASERNNAMSLQLGETAPDFTLDSTQGILNFARFAESHWVVLFSHPKDFTPICTTELGAFALRKAEFDQRGAKLLGLSVDAVEDHQAWARDI